MGRLAPHVILLESETPEPAPCLGASWTPPGLGPAGSRFTFRWLGRTDPSLLCGRLWALTIDSHSIYCPCWCCWHLRHGLERGGRVGRLGSQVILHESETPEPAPCLGAGWTPPWLGPKHQRSADGLPFVSPRNPELPFAGPNAANQCPPMDFKRVLTHGPAGSRFTFRWLGRTDPSLLCGRLWALTIDGHSPFCPCWCCWYL